MQLAEYYINKMNVICCHPKMTKISYRPILGNYVKVENSYCYPSTLSIGSYNTYDTLKKAELACNLNDTCVGVVDIGCNGNEFIACGKHFLTHELLSGCIYK